MGYTYEQYYEDIARVNNTNLSDELKARIRTCLYEKANECERTQAQTERNTEHVTAGIKSK